MSQAYTTSYDLNFELQKELWRDASKDTSVSGLDEEREVEAEAGGRTRGCMDLDEK